jgi:UDP-perosamine 4-acetyltransferase
MNNPLDSSVQGNPTHALKVVIIGGGGHAKVVIDAMQRSATHILAGILSTGNETEVYGVPVLGGDDLLPTLRDQGIEGFFVAIGSNVVRRKLFDKAVAAGLTPVNVIHPSAVISPHVTLGSGIVVMANGVINPGSTIGDNVIINTGTTVDHDADIGADVHIAPGSHLAGNVTVGAGSFLGVGTVVIPGITIGQRVVIGAGTAVYRNLPDDAKVVGGAMRYLSAMEDSTDPLSGQS